MVYIDDILMYSSNKKEHLQYLRVVLGVLQETKLYINLRKCTFMTPSSIFLGFVISEKGVHVDEDEIKVIRDWPIPTSVTEVQSFLGLATFYPCFI